MRTEVILLRLRPVANKTKFVYFKHIKMIGLYCTDDEQLKAEVRAMTCGGNTNYNQDNNAGKYVYCTSIQCRAFLVEFKTFFNYLQHRIYDLRALDS